LEWGNNVVFKQSLKLTADESLVFEKSYERLRAMCTVIANNITHDIGLAEDVVQSAFVKIMEHREKYFSMPAHKRDGYIVVMVKNRAIDTIRSRKNSEIPIDDNVVAISDVEKSFEDKEGYEYLLKLIKELPPLYQVVFEMRYVMEFNNDEIAQMLAIEKTAVAMQLKRAREKMKKKISTKVVILIVAIFLAVSALMFNDDVRAATLERFINWVQNTFVLYFHGDGGLSRHYFWQPEYVPHGLPIIFYEHNYDYDMGASSHIMYSATPTICTDSLFVIFSASWMQWFEDDTIWSGKVFPVDYVEHTIIEENGIEYHLFIAQTNEALDGLGGFPVSVFWEYRGFEFQVLGNIDPDLIVNMALSVVIFCPA